MGRERGKKKKGGGRELRGREGRERRKFKPPGRRKHFRLEVMRGWSISERISA